MNRATQRSFRWCWVFVLPVVGILMDAPARKQNAKGLIAELGSIGIGDSLETVRAMFPQSPHQYGCFSIQLKKHVSFVDAHVVTTEGTVSGISAGGWIHGEAEIAELSESYDRLLKTSPVVGVMRSVAQSGTTLDVPAKVWMNDHVVVVLFWDVAVTERNAESFGVYVHVSANSTRTSNAVGIAFGNQKFVAK